MQQGGKCWYCGHSLDALDYGRGDTCPKGRRDTRTCKGCGFYDPKAYNECREPQADRVVEKERSNFCDYFKPSNAQNDSSQKNAALSAAEALFKKK